MNEDAQSLSNESQNFMWRLEGIRFQEETFFLKVSMTEFRPNFGKALRTFFQVTRKARRGRWFFFVQVGGLTFDNQKETLSILTYM